MKQLIIFLLAIILLIIGYSQYKKYKRFTPPEYQYARNDNIDLNYHDRTFLLNYYKAVEDLNGYVITQWSTNEMDVRNPGDNDEEELAAVSKYNEKLAVVKFYEDQLLKSKTLKDEGLTNHDIKMLEIEGITLADEKKRLQESKRLKMYHALFNEAKSTNGLRLGSKNAFIYELQKLLVSKGYDIPIDGVFKTITVEAIKNFEEKHQLFPDGKIDTFTFNKLLK